MMSFRRFSATIRKGLMMLEVGFDPAALAVLIADKLDQIRKVIVNGLDSNFQQPEIFRKFRWLMEQYNGLYILGDNLRFDIMPLNHQIPGHNVHYQYTDDFYARQRAGKK
ncbi:hypothetical protein EZ456_04445 [Pedobacter psychrodurus]|uniref:Uncharacterized protein n=1 Tax=Pedobacter psychrodurus TaxID=2530456 RepID=A0A4R0Q9R4_9SPHI|nr:hypothetical protein [Pedobacter psychrodurus]TCD28644.1 hypothetical protein EZ456_04445 [Pedobacter psychrodurus]